MRTIRRIAEEEYILVVLLAGFGLIFLLIFPPAIFVNDSWLNLMAGREVVDNGLPSRDEITLYGLGNTWTDQQWLAQIFIYGAYSLGSHALLSIVTATLVVLAFAIATAVGRATSGAEEGAGPARFAGAAERRGGAFSCRRGADRGTLCHGLVDRDSHRRLIFR